jgi:uncharacterized protein (DUF1697 family)
MPPSRKRRKIAEDDDDDDVNKMRMTWIALLRGINVGGSRRVPMAELRSVLTAEKHTSFRNVKTYIQSGNVVFTSAKSSDVLCDSSGECIQENFGFRPPIMLFKHDELQQAFDNNPYQSEGAENPSKVHFFFLGQKPDKTENLELSIDKVKADSEEYSLDQQVFYLSAPDGIGRSKLASKIERLLGVSATGRNYRTIEKILAMAKEADCSKEADDKQTTMCS